MARALRVVPDPVDDGTDARDRRHRAVVIDEWGASELALSIGRSLAAIRWQVQIDGTDNLPGRTGALLVTNPRQFAMVPPMVALALGQRLGRTVRFAGHPDIALASLVLRRVGAVLDDPDEVEGVLRGGDVVVVGASASGPQLADALPWTWPFAARHRRAGQVPAAHVGAALRAGAPVHPVAALSWPLGRAARIEVGPPVRPQRSRRGPLATAELADRVQRHLEQRVAELTGADRTGRS